MSEIAIIAREDFVSKLPWHISYEKQINTPFGKPSAPLIHANLEGKDIITLDSYGNDKAPIASHLVNHRANIWALKESGVKRIISIVTGGGIRSDLIPGSIAIPDQLIDYTYRPDHSFMDTWPEHLASIDFSYPFHQQLRQQIISTVKQNNLTCSDRATMGVFLGPRFQTMAEIARMEKDGCDLVTMGGMPEASLARELGMEYASIAVIGGRAAGRMEGAIISFEEIKQAVAESTASITILLQGIIRLL